MNEIAINDLFPEDACNCPPAENEMRHFRVFLVLALTIASVAIVLAELAGWLFA